MNVESTLLINSTLSATLTLNGIRQITEEDNFILLGDSGSTTYSNGVYTNNQETINNSVLTIQTNSSFTADIIRLEPIETNSNVISEFKEIQPKTITVESIVNDLIVKVEEEDSFILIGDNNSAVYDAGYYATFESSQNPLSVITATSEVEEITTLYLTATSSVETIDILELATIPLSSESTLKTNFANEIESTSNGIYNSLLTEDVNIVTEVNDYIISQINVNSESIINVIESIDANSIFDFNSLITNDLITNSSIENDIIRNITTTSNFDDWYSLFTKEINQETDTSYRFFRIMQSSNSVDSWNSFLLPVDSNTESSIEYDLIKEIDVNEEVISDFVRLLDIESSSLAEASIIDFGEVQVTSSTEQLITLIYNAIINSNSNYDISITKVYNKSIKSKLTVDSNIQKIFDSLAAINASINYDQNSFVSKVYDKSINSKLEQNTTVSKIIDILREINSQSNIDTLVSKSMFDSMESTLTQDVLVNKNLLADIGNYFYSVSDILITDNNPLKEGSVFVYSKSNDFNSLNFDIDTYVFIRHTLLTQFNNQLHVYNDTDKFFTEKQTIDFNEEILHSFVFDNKAYLLTGEIGNYKITEIIENVATKKVFISKILDINFNYSIDSMKVVEDSIFLSNNTNYLTYVINIRTEKFDTIDINEFFNNDYDTTNSILGYDIEKFNDRYLLSTPGVINNNTSKEGGLVSVYDKHELVNKK